MNDNQPKSKLQLYVVGEPSGDPHDWNPYGTYGERAIILAGSPEEARAMTDLPGEPLLVATESACLLSEQSCRVS